MSEIILGQGTPYRASSSQMIRTLAINRFRCFEEAKLPDCRRINIIVGDNASGKTSLLEALFLVAGPSPEIAIRLRQWRGFEGNLVGTPRQLETALWVDLFHGFDPSVAARVMARGDVVHTRRLTIVRSPQTMLVRGKTRQNPNGGLVSFKWNISNEEPIEIIPRVQNGGIIVPPVAEPPTDTFFFSANRTYSSTEAATRLSKLSKESSDGIVIESFKRHYPLVEDLSVELSDGVPMIYCKLAAFKHKVPLNTVSGGMNKLAAILLSFPTSPGCVVLIDEIENGFYFRRFPEIWRTLRAFCVEYNAQVFATTHSIECLDSASAVSAAFPDDFSIIHAGKGALRQYGGDRFSAAMSENIEIR